MASSIAWLRMKLADTLWATQQFASPEVCMYACTPNPSCAVRACPAACTAGPPWSQQPSSVHASDGGRSGGAARAEFATLHCALRQAKASQQELIGQLQDARKRERAALLAARQAERDASRAAQLQQQVRRCGGAGKKEGSPCRRHLHACDSKCA